MPPIGGALYFLRPGTLKLPLFEGLPVVGGARRTVLDVALYATNAAILVWGLTAPAVGPEHLWPLVVTLPLMGITDRTLFLVHRSEHYLSLVICLLFAEHWIAGSKFVWMAECGGGRRRRSSTTTSPP